MKQIMMTLLLLLAMVTATAQNTKGKGLNERLFNAKVSEMVYRLHITEEQKEKFVPIYRKYSEEMQSIWNGNAKPSRPTNSKEAAALAKRKMERQQKAQAIRMKYVDELATVLDAEQINDFFDVESSIQRKLMQRIKKSMANKP